MASGPCLCPAALWRCGAWGVEGCWASRRGVVPGGWGPGSSHCRVRPSRHPEQLLGHVSPVLSENRASEEGIRCGGRAAPSSPAPSLLRPPERSTCYLSGPLPPGGRGWEALAAEGPAGSLQQTGVGTDVLGRVGVRGCRLALAAAGDGHPWDGQERLSAGARLTGPPAPGM